MLLNHENEQKLAALGVLARIEGMESVVRVSAETQGESRTRFLLESLQLLVNYHEKDGRLAKIVMVNLVPVGVAADGSQIVALAIDYGAWDRTAAAFAAREEFSDSR